MVKRVALCFSGRASQDSRFCLTNLMRNFISPLERMGYRVDTFAHLWKVDDYQEALDIIDPVAWSLEEDRSEELKHKFEDRIFAKHGPRIEYLNPNVKKGKMFWYPYTPNMFYSIKEANRLKSLFESELDFTYDLVARMRTDNISQEGDYTKELEKVVDCPPRTLWVPTDYVGSGAQVVPQFDYVVDNFAIGTSEALDAYAETLDALDDFFDVGMAGYKPGNWPKLKLKGAYWLCGTMVGYALKRRGIKIRAELAPGFTVLRKVAARAEVNHRRGLPVNPVMQQWLEYKGVV